MNFLKKSYCRIYQTVFRMLIPVLPYRKPKILKKAEDIPPLLKKNGIKRILIVTDSGIEKEGLIKGLKDALNKEGVPFSVYSETAANPTINNVETALSLYHKDGCRALVGFGGGSSIDCAKAVAARIARPKKSISKMKGILKVLKKTPLLFAVPTTAGTGSETTLAAVITDDKTRHKFPINDFPLIPSYAVLDSNLTKSLPPHLTAATGMDALTHAVEAYIGRSTTAETRAQSEKAVRLIMENLQTAYADGASETARENMLRASFLAGAAFTKSYVGYCHAAAHALGGKYNIPHGLANAVILPIVLEKYGKSAYKKLKKLALAAKLCSDETSDEEGAMIFTEKVRTMNREMNIGATLSGICPDDIPYLARIAEKEANPLYPVPRLMDKKELEEIFYIAGGINND